MAIAFGLLLLLVGAVSGQDSTAGHIAWLDLNYNVWRYDVARGLRVQLTNDGTEFRRHLWPTWSSDGRLAWFSHEIVDGELVLEAWVQHEPGGPASLRYRGGEVFNYAYWSPDSCVDDQECRMLGLLLSSNAQGMFVELVRDAPSSIGSSVRLRGGPPFYFSWSPDGGRLLLQRNNRRFDIYDVPDDQIQATLDATPGRIQAPQWSPVDDRLLLGVRQPDGRSALVVQDAANSQVLAENLPGAVAFNWSPDGQSVAWREQTVEGYGPLVISDAASGERLTGSLAEGVLAFVWAPDGKRIAWLEFDVPGRSVSASRANNLLAQAGPALPGLRWRLLDLESGATQVGLPFFPTQEMLYYITYFDQFAQSHRLWSPDSRQLVYGELRRGGPVVQLLDADRMGEEPTTLASGWIGIWDYGKP
ncbi:MAG: hypothetical protein OXB89_02745 [Anaerolineaceae bacterium]|nr:hypothetical protein [Anaerolineaceae bacterium]